MASFDNDGYYGTNTNTPAPVPAGIKGRVTSPAAAAGVVGEMIEATISATLLSASYADITGAVLALTEGWWLIGYSVSSLLLSGGSTADDFQPTVVLTDQSNNLIPKTTRSYRIKPFLAQVVLAGPTFMYTGLVYVTTAQNYKLRGKSIAIGGTNTSNIINTTDAESNFYAMRVLT